jgi:hypothetical protein
MMRWKENKFLHRLTHLTMLAGRVDIAPVWRKRVCIVRQQVLLFR